MNTFTKMAEDWIRQNCAPADTEKPTVLPTVATMIPLTEEFHKWALERCVYRDRCFGGIGSLYHDFCKWIVTREESPCTRLIFERLLDTAGFLSADGMVSGLILREDFEASKKYHTVRAIAELNPVAANYVTP